MLLHKPYPIVGKPYFLYGQLLRAFICAWAYGVLVLRGNWRSDNLPTSESTTPITSLPGMQCAALGSGILSGPCALGSSMQTLLRIMVIGTTMCWEPPCGTQTLLVEWQVTVRLDSRQELRVVLRQHISSP